MGEMGRLPRVKGTRGKEARVDSGKEKRLKELRVYLTSANCSVGL